MNELWKNKRKNEQTKDEELYVDHRRRPFFRDFEGVEVEEWGKLGRNDERVAATLLEWVGDAVRHGAERKTDKKKIYLESVWVVVGELGHTQYPKIKINDLVGGGGYEPDDSNLQ